MTCVIMRPWSDAFESSVVWTRRQPPLRFSRLPAGKRYKASASAPRQYQQSTMCSPVAWGLSVIFSFILFFSSSNYVWLTKNEHEAILLATMNEIICSGLLWRPWKRTVLNNLPLSFLHSHSHNSYTSTQTSISDGLYYLLLLHLERDPVNKWPLLSMRLKKIIPSSPPPLTVVCAPLKYNLSSGLLCFAKPIFYFFHSNSKWVCYSFPLVVAGQYMQFSPRFIFLVLHTNWFDHES